MNQVGSPEMLLGNKFFPLTGTPISNNDCKIIRFDDCEPVPLAVATLTMKSLIFFPITFIASLPIPHGYNYIGMTSGLMYYHQEIPIIFFPTIAAILNDGVFAGSMPIPEELQNSWDEAVNLTNSDEPEKALEVLRNAWKLTENEAQRAHKRGVPVSGVDVQVGAGPGATCSIV